MRIVSGSGGSFLAPPGHPNHRFHIEGGRRDNPNLIASLDYAIDNEYGDVSETLRKRVQKLFDEATLIRSDLWEREVYGYFKNCYSPDGVDRNASNALIVGTGGVTCDDPRITPEHSLAFLLVRTYFPDAEPCLDLLDRADLYGIKQCVKCGTKLQYEAKVDAFAEPISARVTCPEMDQVGGGNHTIEGDDDE